MAEAFDYFLEKMPDTTEFKKLRKRLIRETKEAIDNYAMLKRGEKWLVCLSGGKDSYTLLAMLLDLQWRGQLPVELVACNLDQGQPDFPQDILPAFLDDVGVAYHIETQDTYSIVTDKIPATQTYCALCSRLRRGILYGVARDLGCQAIVLGHHREDVLETFFMNFFHGGRLATMPAKLVNDEGDLQVLRPLINCAEADIAKYARDMAFPIIPCNLCGSQEGLQRESVKAMLEAWEIDNPGRKQVMFKALGNLRLSHLLDTSVYDFEALQPVGGHNGGEKLALAGKDSDSEPCPASMKLLEDMLVP